MKEDELAREIAVVEAQYRLSPDVPDKEREHFIQFYILFSKLSALSYIREDNIPGLMIEFDNIAMAYDDGYYDIAREAQARFLTKMQLCRSIDGFETKWTSGSFTRAEHVEDMLAKTKRKTFGDKLRGLFGKKEESKEGER